MKTNQPEILQSFKVLYVEDEQETREELQEFLKRRVGKVYTAQNGIEGFDLYEEYLPDIIIVDLFMPKMGGIEMLNKINETYASRPFVIVTSAISDVNILLNAVNTGIDNYLVKPIDVNELIQALYSFSDRVIRKNQGLEQLDIGSKKQFEATIKKEFSAFLKTKTGKGPKDVSVFIGNGVVEINATEIFTIYEKSLLDYSQNFVIIEQNRKMFYAINEEELCKLLSSRLHRNCILQKVLINTEKDKNKLIFSIE